MKYKLLLLKVFQMPYLFVLILAILGVETKTISMHSKDLYLTSISVTNLFKSSVSVINASSCKRYLSAISLMFLEISSTSTESCESFASITVSV